MGALADAYAVLRSGTLWSSTGRCQGYGVANPGEAAKIDAYVAGLDAGQTPSPPSLATATGRGLVGMLTTLATKPAPTPTPAPSGPAPFPSRLHVASGHICDETGYDLGVLRGFNVHCHPTVGSTRGQYWGPGGSWGSSAYSFMQQAGMRLQRVICHWDAFQPSPGSAGISADAIADLDACVANAGAAGLYTLLDIHLNVNRVPAWARTGKGELVDFQTNGAALVAYLAFRYVGDAHVVGINVNEPPSTSLPAILAMYQAFVPWWREAAPSWPVWVQPSGYGNGTPVPRVGIAADLAAYLALDTKGRGVVAEFHDYLNQVGLSSADGYQANGTIDPIQQVGASGSQYHGWGGGYAYPGTAESRAALQVHVAPWAAFRDRGGGRVALAIGEWGIDNAKPGETFFGVDKTDAFRGAGACVELWWDYDQATIASNGFSARPGGTSWRASVQAWITDATPRA